MTRKLAYLIFAAWVGTPFIAHAQFAKIEDAVKYRQSAFSLMGTHVTRLGSVVKGEKPFDKASVEADVAIIDMMAKLPWNAFPAGSDTVDSKAKPEIWKEPEKFKAASDKLQTDVAKLSAAAKSGDLNAVKSAFGAMGQSCKACHDSYRIK